MQTSLTSQPKQSQTHQIDLKTLTPMTFFRDFDAGSVIEAPDGAISHKLDSPTNYLYIATPRTGSFVYEEWAKPVVDALRGVELIEPGERFKINFHPQKQESHYNEAHQLPPAERPFFTRLTLNEVVLFSNQSNNSQVVLARLTHPANGGKSYRSEVQRVNEVQSSKSIEASEERFQEWVDCVAGIKDDTRPYDMASQTFVPSQLDFLYMKIQQVRPYSARNPMRLVASVSSMLSSLPLPTLR